MNIDGKSEKNCGLLHKIFIDVSQINRVKPMEEVRIYHVIYMFARASLNFFTLA